jgi:hypothetical protein
MQFPLSEIFMGYQGNKYLVCGLAGIALVIPITSFAAGAGEAERIRDLESKLERSLQMIEVLQRRVQEIEAVQTSRQAPDTTSPQDTAQAVKIEALEQQVAQLGSGLSMRQSDTGVPLHGFADVGLRYSSENNRAYGKGLKGFNVGTLDLFITPQFGEHVRMLAEPAIEVDESGEAEFDLERLQVGYVFSDALTAWAGRFHSPFGYWNTAFHHGAQIQTSLLRPRFLDFEDKGGILPDHTTGAWMTGSVSSAGNKYGYDLYLGNSQRILTDGDNPVGPGAIATGTLDMKMGGSNRTNAVAGFNTWIAPAHLPNLRIGLHGIYGDISAENGHHGILAESRLQMLGGYGVYTNDNWEIMSEYYRFNNRDLSHGSGTHQSSAWYGQAAYSFGLFTPYLRMERAGLDQDDPYFAYQTNGRSYARVALGLRYEVDPKAALKVEFNHTRQRDLVDSTTGKPVSSDAYSEAIAQYSVRF